MPAIEHFNEDAEFDNDGSGSGESVIVSGWPECELRDEPMSGADVAAVLTGLRDSLVRDRDAAAKRSDLGYTGDDYRLAMNNAIGQVQSAMHQLGIDY